MKVSTSSVVGAALAVVNAVYAVLLTFGVLELSDVEKGAVLLVANTTAALALALWAHFRRSTVEEPVAVGVALLAWTSSVLALLAVFSVWGLTVAKTSAIQSLIVVLVGIPTAIKVRSSVTSNAGVEIAKATAQTPDAILAATNPRLRPPEGGASATGVPVFGGGSGGGGSNAGAVTIKSVTGAQ